MDKFSITEFFEALWILLTHKEKKLVLLWLMIQSSMVKEVVAKYPNVKVDSWSGLLVDYCKTNGVSAIVKGLRAVSDFDYELQMAQMNLQLKGVDTLFMATTPAYSFLSSSLVKEIANYGGDVSALVPANVLSLMKARLAEGGNRGSN